MSIDGDGFLRGGKAVDSSSVPRIVPFGDSAVLIVLGDAIAPETNRRVHRLAGSVASLRASDPRFGQPIPAYASLLVPVDPLELGTDRAVELLGELLAESRAAADEDDDDGKLVEIPTRYGGVDGPDLAAVAAAHDLHPVDVIELHASVEYRVYMLGFAPGFAYLASVPEAIATPRRATPRTAVPAGSVGIAGVQTGIYPFEAPGGWQLIGRTSERLWLTDRTPPALLAPGDRVRFSAIR